MSAQEVHKSFIKLANKKIADHSERFFKTGKGEYGENDRFLGIRVPVIRNQVKLHKNITLDHTAQLLKSTYHEERLFALLVLVDRFSKADEKGKSRVYKLYMKNLKYVNNWDLVDSSASQIVGAYLTDKDKKPLYDLAKSKNLWRRRVAIMSTYYFIKQNEFNDALKISILLINDTEDLIHKATGWMLREIGNRSPNTERVFLKKHYPKMPRTMLRYAIEKFPEKERKAYLNGTAQ